MLHLTDGHMRTPAEARLFLAQSVSDDWVRGGATLAGERRTVATYTLVDDLDRTAATARCDNRIGRTLAPAGVDVLTADEAVAIFSRVCTMGWRG